MQFLEVFSFFPPEPQIFGPRINTPIVMVYKNGVFCESVDGTNTNLDATMKNMIVKNGGFEYNYA
jgi:hypothetical protein